MTDADHFVAPVAMGHPTYTDTFDFVHQRIIDIQTHTVGKSFLENLFCYILHDMAHRLEIGIIIMIAERIGNRRNMLPTSLCGNPHRTRTMCIDRSIVTMIEATENQVGFTGT